MEYLCVVLQGAALHQALSPALVQSSGEPMNAYPQAIKLDLPTNDRRASQLDYLCHFLEAFASREPVMRAAACHYSERLRDEGCESGEIIRMAATALLVAIEQELEDKKAASDRSPVCAESPSVMPMSIHDRAERQEGRAA